MSANFSSDAASRHKPYHHWRQQANHKHRKALSRAVSPTDLHDDSILPLGYDRAMMGGVSIAMRAGLDTG